MAVIGLQLLMVRKNGEWAKKAILEGTFQPWNRVHKHLEQWLEEMKHKVPENKKVINPTTTAEYQQHFNRMDNKKESSYSNRSVTVYKNAARCDILSEAFAKFITLPVHFGYEIK